MEIFREIDQVNVPGPTFLTIGNFDGLHLGHQALLENLEQQAISYRKNMERPAYSGLLTFEPHPLTVLQPGRTIKLLTQPQERVVLAAKHGIDLGIIQRFDRGFAALDVKDFLLSIKRNLGLACLTVGPDFAMGKGRSGDIPRLRELGREIGFDLTVLEPVDLVIDHQTQNVRSSAIRQFLTEGQVGNAAKFLGRTYHLQGLTVQGDQRGRQIGVPTANLLVDEDKLLPKDGVYATRTWIIPETMSADTHLLADLMAAQAPVFNSVTNLGNRPTVDGQSHRIETHLLDFPTAGISDDLYGRTLAVEFIVRLRDEQRFNGLDALVTQIRADIEQARNCFQEVD